MKQIHISIQTSFLLIGLGMMMVQGMLFFFREAALVHQTLEEELQDHAIREGNRMATALEKFFLTNNSEIAEGLIGQWMTDPSLDLVVLLDEHRKVHFSSRYDWKGKDMEDIFPGSQPWIQSIQHTRKNQHQLDASSDRVWVGLPVKMGIRPGELRANKVGVLFLVKNMQPITDKARESGTRSFVLLMTATGTITLLAWVIGAWRIKKRVRPLVDAGTQWAQGNYSARSDLQGRDEFSQVGRVFDQMATRIQARENQLKESEVKFRVTFEQAAIGMALVNTSGRFLQVNHRLCDMLGYDALSLTGINWRRISRIEHHPEEENLLSELIHGNKEIFQLEKQLIQRDGKTLWVQLTAAWIPPQGSGDGYFIHAIEDISQRKSMEHLKDEFVSMVSHELRTPVTSILGSVGLLIGLKNPSQTAMEADLLKITKRNAEQLVRLVNDLLDIQKFRAGKLDMHLTDLRLDEVLADSVQANQGFADQFQVALVLKQPLIPMVVSADRERLMQVLANLISNAVKFSKPGDQVEIGAENRDGNPLVWVTDHGEGIPDEFKDRIFQPFSQADSSSTRKKGGTGLGLNISKSIVESIGGKLTFTSKVQQGTSFQILFNSFPKESGNSLHA
ncbi:MAG: ATP-binding protein [Deltaproteobacteria bacterium]|nr:ATP-binding protein [Deltaproteobacteria bacterium]